MTARQLNSIAALCRSHRRRSYLDDGEGLVGVYNHADRVIWYRWTEAGYSATGSSDTAEGATHRFLR